MKKFLSVFLFALPVVVFFVFVLKYSVNVPFWDDFDAVLGFLTKYSDFTSLTDRLWLILSQHTEHRFALNRLIVLAGYSLGVVNFSALIFIGNLALVGLLFVVYKSSILKENKTFLLLPIPFLIFQPQYHESIYWATAAMCNFFILFFSLLAVLLFSRPKKKYLFLGVLSALFATFTMGNGMFVFLIGALILLYQKRYFDFVFLAPIAVLTILFYFQGYIQTADHPGVLVALKNPFQTLQYFFVLIGAPVAFLKIQAVAFVSGFLATLYFGYLTFTKFFKKNIVVYSSLLFLFITALSMAFARSGFGIEQAFASKYSVFSILFYVLSYISLIENFPKLRGVRYIIGFVLLAVCFNGLSYFVNIDSIKSHNLSVQNKLIYPDINRAKNLLETAVEKGIYTLSSVGD